MTEPEFWRSMKNSIYAAAALSRDQGPVKSNKITEDKSGPTTQWQTTTKNNMPEQPPRTCNICGNPTYLARYLYKHKHKEAPGKSTGSGSGTNLSWTAVYLGCWLLKEVPDEELEQLVVQMYTTGVRREPTGGCLYNQSCYYQWASTCGGPTVYFKVIVGGIPVIAMWLLVHWHQLEKDSIPMYSGVGTIRTENIIM